MLIRQGVIPGFESLSPPAKYLFGNPLVASWRVGTTDDTSAEILFGSRSLSGTALLLGGVGTRIAWTGPVDIARPSPFEITPHRAVGPSRASAQHGRNAVTVLLRHLPYVYCR